MPSVFASVLSDESLQRGSKGVAYLEGGTKTTLWVLALSRLTRATHDCSPRVIKLTGSFTDRLTKRTDCLLSPLRRTGDASILTVALDISPDHAVSGMRELCILEHI